METLFAELVRQMARVYHLSAADAAARVAVIRATARDRGWEWVELAGPAIAATCRALDITPTPRNLDAYTFNHE